MIKNIKVERDFLYVLPFSFVLFFLCFYFIDIQWVGVDLIFVSILFLVFVTVSGFFVTIQGNRHSSISLNVAEFDGELSFLYRSSNVFGKEVQEKIKQEIIKHYQSIKDSSETKSYFIYKNKTIENINNILVDLGEGEGLNFSQKSFLSRAYFSIAELQKKRKILISAFGLRIPSMQWYVLDVLALTVILTIDFLPNNGFVGVLLQAALSTIVLSVLILIRRLNNLSLFGNIIGESTSKDVLDIINTKD
jgi:hypothetical protein